MPIWLAILQGLLTPMIAIITTYIAVQQYRASMLKMRIDRYDRRLKIYQETHKFITAVTSELDLEIRQLFEFETATDGSHKNLVKIKSKRKQNLSQRSYASLLCIRSAPVKSRQGRISSAPA